MKRAATCIWATVSLVAPVVGCGDKAQESIDSADIVRERKLEQRNRRLEQLERRLARLRERDGGNTAHGSGSSAAASSFEQLAAGLGGQVGVTLGPPGAGGVVALGTLRSGPAWSTIKLPIALRVLEQANGPGGLSSAQRRAVEAAITRSDNDAAKQLFESLGSIRAAAAAVTETLREAGDDSTQVSTVGRAGFSPYGQTNWPLVSQHRFMAALAGGCFSDSQSRRYVLDLMSRVSSDIWGLGSVGLPARWKGGWGPGADGRYLARQMGVIDVDGRSLVVTLAALPSDGSFSSAQRMATEVARWLAAEGTALASARGRC